MLEDSAMNFIWTILAIRALSTVYDITALGKKTHTTPIPRTSMTPIFLDGFKSSFQIAGIGKQMKKISSTMVNTEPAG